MMLRIALLLGALCTFATAAEAGSLVHIADRDCTALRNAVASAAAGNDTTIVLARGGDYVSYDAQSDCGIFVPSGRLVIDAAGSELQPLCLARIIDVAAGAHLTLRNAVISEPGCGLTPPIPEDVLNAGELDLESVTFETGSAFTNSAGASMTFRNVTMFGGDINNSGSLSVFNSTLAPAAVNDVAGAELVIANSIVTSENASACAVSGGGLQSLGGNVVHASCGWAISADTRSPNPRAGLGPLQDNGGMGIPTFALSSTSPAHNAGVAQYCEATDARGIARPAGACDAGAVGFDATKYVGEGGMDGTWYDHAANGHYVTIQRVHDDDTALVIWNTFDRSGTQAWIYGVGHVTGRHIHVEMSQNVGGRLQPGGPPTGASVHSWGSVDIDLTNCLSGTLRYQSPLSSFGSGQFPLDRLAYVSDFGCVD